MRPRVSRPPASPSPFVVLTKNLIEPGQLVRIKNLPDAVSVLLSKSIKLLVHLFLENVVPLGSLIHDVTELAYLSGRETEIMGQSIDHTLRVETAVPVARLPGVE